MQDTIREKGRVKTVDLRLAAWLHLNNAQLEAATPVEGSTKCSFTFTPGNTDLEQLMEQWIAGAPVADVRVAINAYLYLVYRGKEILKARGYTR